MKQNNTRLSTAPPARTVSIASFNLRFLDAHSSTILMNALSTFTFSSLDTITVFPRRGATCSSSASFSADSSLVFAFISFTVSAEFNCLKTTSPREEGVCAGLIPRGQDQGSL